MTRPVIRVATPMSPALFSIVPASRIPLDADRGPSVSAGFGASHLIGADAQIDIGYSAGLSSPAPDHAIAIGLSRRW